MGARLDAMPRTILQPGQIEPPAGTFPTLRLPPRTLFRARAERLHALAPGHRLEPMLGFAARLAEWQESAWETLTPDSLPLPEQLAHCRAAGMPPLAAAAGWWPTLGWNGLDWPALARELAPLASEPEALARLAKAPRDGLETQARALLAWQSDGLDLAWAPALGAALQVCWTAAAARLRVDDIAGPGQRQPGLCPVCGSAPVASVLRIGGQEDGLRYLHCGLCASEWHVVRAKCSLCDNTRGLSYLSLSEPSADDSEPPRVAIQAESCPECRGYLKLMRLERNPSLDPWADDLATLALDLLVDREGFERAGLNFLLLQGPHSPP
jgi:FdhE protein